MVAWLTVCFAGWTLARAWFALADFALMMKLFAFLRIISIQFAIMQIDSFQLSAEAIDGFFSPV